MSIERLKEMLKRHEGVKNQPYLCPAHFWTVGVGWNMEANPLPEDIALYLRTHNYITDEMVDCLLNIAIEDATNNCRDIYKDFDSFSEDRRFALIDFVFNVGIGTALTFRNTNRAVNEGRWEDAAKAMENSKYYRQVPNRAKEIVEMIRSG